MCKESFDAQEFSKETLLQSLYKAQSLVQLLESLLEFERTFFNVFFQQGET